MAGEKTVTYNLNEACEYYNTQPAPLHRIVNKIERLS